MTWCSERVASGELSDETAGLSLLIMVYNNNLNSNKLVHRPNSIELKVSMNYRNGRYSHGGMSNFVVTKKT